MFDSLLVNLGLAADNAAPTHHHGFSTPSGSRSDSPAIAGSPPDLSTCSLLSLNNFGSPLSLRDWSPNRSAGLITSAVTCPSPTKMYSPDEGIEDDYSEDNENNSITSPAGTSPPSTSSTSVRKRYNRPKTTYQLAHPPSSTRHRRIRLRPKLLLQLQEITRNSRPVPALDVIPPALAPVLSRRILKKDGSKYRLGPNDLLVVSSDLYDLRTSSTLEDDRSVSSEDDGHDNRELIATVYHLSRDDSTLGHDVEIYFPTGISWKGAARPNGSYEFTTTSGGHYQSQTVRWVVRGKKPQRVGLSSDPAKVSKKLTFSVITPNSRRHPVLATMTSSCIDVHHEFAMPSVFRSTTPTPPSIPMVNETEKINTRETLAVEASLQTLILVTGIWVAFQEGWSRIHFPHRSNSGTANVSESPLPPRRRSLTTSRPDKGAEFDNGNDSNTNNRSSQQKRRNQLSNEAQYNGSPTLPPFSREHSLTDSSTVPMGFNEGKKRINRRSTSAIMGDNELAKRETAKNNRFRTSLQLMPRRGLSDISDQAFHYRQTHYRGETVEEAEQDGDGGGDGNANENLAILKSPTQAFRVTNPSLEVAEDEPKLSSSKNGKAATMNQRHRLIALSPKTSGTALSLTSASPSIADSQQKSKSRRWHRFSGIFSRKKG